MTISGAWEESGDYTPGLANTLENHLNFDVEASDSPLEISEAVSANRTYARSEDGEYYEYFSSYEEDNTPSYLQIMN